MEIATALLLIRIVVGGLFVGHGTQKLFGWFGGGGIDGTADFFESLGYRQGRVSAILAGTAETAGGLSLLFGFLTPIGGALLVGVMINAILAAHWEAGLWNEQGGFEYPVVLAVTAVALALTGPGAVSVDAALGLQMSGILWAGVALLFGFAASFAAIGPMSATTVEE